jgi:DNA-binding transcriptional regulator YiaG
MSAIDADARSLDAAGRRLAQAIQKLSGLEMQYEQAVQEQLVTLHHESKESGERLPAEDIRRALAHRKVSREVYGAYLASRAEVDALRAWCRATEASLSAKQSLLNAMKAELRAVA